MDSGIIIVLILGASSVVSSFFFGFIPNTKREAQHKQEQLLLAELSSYRTALETKNNQLLLLSKQIISYYNLESILLDELAKNGINRTTLQKKYRKKIREAGLSKITVTDSDAEKILLTII